MEKFEKKINVALPFDMRAEDPHKNYGIGGFRIWYILKGPKGAVQFMFGVNAYLPHLIPEYYAKGIPLEQGKISGWDVGYHSYEPPYEGHACMEDCETLGGKCYYDGSSLRADDWAKEIFSERGQKLEPLIWGKLEEEYALRFSTQEQG